MLDKRLSTFLARSVIFHGEVRGLDPSPLGFDRFGRPMVLFRDFVPDADYRLVRRGCVKVVVEVFEGAVGGFRVQEVD